MTWTWREKSRFVVALVAVLGILLASPLGAAGGRPAPFKAEGWLNGADGLVKGITAAETEGKVLVVYFYTDWCGYCRQFEKTLLTTPGFEKFLQGAVAVRVNPDKGEKERNLAGHYGVRGYPSFFVWGGESKKLIKTDRYDLVNGQPKMLSPEKFVARIEQTSLR